MADHGLTDEELDSLSDSEREAILSSSDDADDAAADDADPDTGPEEDDELDAAPAEAAAVVAAVAAEPAAEAVDAEPPEFTPRLVVEAPADAATKFTEFASQKEALRAHLSDGDIGLDEYTAQLDVIGKEERALERQVWEAESAQKQNTQQDLQRWEWEQEQFFADKTNEAYKDKYLLTAFNAAIIDLANAPENASKKGPWFLSEANKMIRERFGMAKPTIEPPKPPRRPNIPPTLGGMPSAELPETGGGNEFGHLDKLKGFELEAAVARMSPAEQERYSLGG